MTSLAGALRGQRAPDFSLPSGPDRHITLAQFHGAPVVLAFYPADWSPVCSDQMALYQAVMPEFTRYGATVLGISVDGVWCHRAFAEDRGISFPLLSDFEPKGEVARRYHSYRLPDGVAERALFVLDRDGYVAWSHIYPPHTNPGADGILHALEALTHERQAVV
ncbi:redoxin domain-containing protein [Planosporangium flavigriseum]|nr:redoxin domain-containing protein [Planosporangium flavigriseum]NJC67703.1 redoxin domain-containing protein [Planosporangium flavigriseum]